jgi:transcriptional regulator with XRE-family HTH domain
MSESASNEGIPEITLGWRLRIAMERANLKAEYMAEELGVHRGTITRWTHDIGRPPRPIYLRHWAELCGVRFEWLAGEHARPTATVGGVGRGDNRQAAGRDTHGLLADTLAA